MVQVVDLTDCTRGNLTCSIKEEKKQSHPRKSAEMSSQWKRNSPEKPNAGSWTRGWMKSPEKDTTSSAVMCATPPYWSDPFRKSRELSLYYSLSDKTYVTITASTTSQTTPHYQKKEDQVVFDEVSTPFANSKTWYSSPPQHKHVCKLVTIS